MALAGVAQWIERGPVNQWVTVQFPVRVHAWVAGQVPSRGLMKGNNTLKFLSLFLLPFCSLKIKINKIFFLKKGTLSQFTIQESIQTHKLLLRIEFAKYNDRSWEWEVSSYKKTISYFLIHMTTYLNIQILKPLFIATRKCCLLYTSDAADDC